MSRDNASLLDISRAAELILSFVDGVDRADFDTDVKTQSAVIHQLLVLGEAASRLSQEFRATRPDIPWRR